VILGSVILHLCWTRDGGREGAVSDKVEHVQARDSVFGTGISTCKTDGASRTTNYLYVAVCH